MRLRLFALGLFLLASPSWSLDFGIGPRLSLAKGDTAWILGGQVIVSDFGIDFVAPLRLKSSLDWGWGKTDDGQKFKSRRVNFDLEYVLYAPSQISQFYLLSGVGLLRLEPKDCGCPENVWGVNLGGGFLYRRLQAEFSLGVGNLPTFQITGSYLFGF